MGLTPAGATYGTYSWTDEFDHSEGTPKVQNIKFKAAHTVHVYFADYNKPFSYFVIDIVRVSADPGKALRNDKDGRGYFNSSSEVAYRSVSASDNCGVRQTAFAPSGTMANRFAFDFIGTEMVLNADKAGGDGRMVFKPTESMNSDTTVQGWGIEPTSGDGWVLHQKDVWNALGEDGQGTARATREMLDALFEGTPFGNVALLPNASFSPVRCDFVSMWHIEKTGGNPFTLDQRAVTLTLKMDYVQRLTTFTNGKVGPDFDAMRKSIAVQPSTIPVQRDLKLHEIAKNPS